MRGCHQEGVKVNKKEKKGDKKTFTETDNIGYHFRFSHNYTAITALLTN